MTMSEITSKELLAVIAYSDLNDCEVAIKLGSRYIVGKLTSIEVSKETEMLTRFKIEGFVVVD